MSHSQMQLGKNGVTKDFLVTLKSHFENHDNVKVSVMRGATRDREELTRISQEILKELGNKYTARIIGFTIFFKRWRKEMW